MTPGPRKAKVSHTGRRHEPAAAVTFDWRQSLSIGQLLCLSRYTVTHSSEIEASRRVRGGSAGRAGEPAVAAAVPTHG